MYAKYEENPEQNRILRHLKDMFTTMPHWRLREVGKANNWNLDSCIEQLMNIVANNASFDNKTVKATKQQLQQRSKGDKKVIGKGSFNKEEERIGHLIKKGYRVMILLRGPPGVGKSYLARSLVNNFIDFENNGYNISDFVCSSDDYFYNSKGVYKYNPNFLSDAHEFNQQRVRDKTKSGLSPIIVDNTNLQLWEMLPYVKHAVLNNYVIEILEPKTPWRNSAGTLAQKNKHGVPRNRIQQMMEKYEKCSVASLTRMLKNTKYTKTLPQMRSIPPIYTAPFNYEPEQAANDSGTKEELLEKVQSQVWDDVATTVPKEQRTKFKSNRSPSKSFEDQECPVSTTRDVYSLLEQKATNVWKSFESEAAEFWGTKQELNDSSKSTSGEKSLLDLLREDNGNISNEIESVHQDNIGDTKSICSIERHGINCPNENTAFISLRQIYPNKRVSGLWDLFVKCNGDVEWAVDILLKEDELERIRGEDDFKYQTEDDEIFNCLCNNVKRECEQSPHTSKTRANVDKYSTSDDNVKPSLFPTNAKPQRHRSRFSRSNQLTNPALLEVKENIENCFDLADDHYSEHLLKIRKIRNGTNDITGCSIAPTKSYESVENQVENPFINKEVADDSAENDDDEEDDEDNESDEFNDMLEISLGEQLIQQLVNTFKNESSLEEQISSTSPANLKVFMPRSLAKQLYMLWVESAYNHIEEERQKLVKEDEDFARLLKNPNYSEFKQSPSNLQEILDMEYAWNIYYQEKDEQHQQENDIEKMHLPNDLASHLTQMKLCEVFPDIPRETLLDILATKGNNYNATVTTLRSTMQLESASITQEHLMECGLQEQDLQIQNQIDQRRGEVSSNWDDNELTPSLSPDEAKRLALRKFEESRNLSAHHCQLKAECYQKAKEAIQSGNSGAGIYYSQIANFHKKKIDMYNHRAANCIMDVHKYTQNNPDLLDLHYLHLIEALGCLDLFLDRHITRLRIESRNYKHVFIITGRGKHSAGGVSTIKNKVKARLKERCLRWSEVNPGLLKVKIFSGSRHSKNI